MQVKICGITRLEDAEVACQLGANALGFIFYPKSPRHIDYTAAGKIAKHLPDDVARVAVFVNPAEKDIASCKTHFQPDFLQIHGEHSPQSLERLAGEKLLPAFQVGADFIPTILAGYPDNCRGFLLDAYKPGKYGGTGSTFDWRLAIEAKKYGNIVLSGGLSPENIREAITRVRPTAVDVNSGVEQSPGVKDAEKLKHLFEIIKEIENDDDNDAKRFLSSR